MLAMRSVSPFSPGRPLELAIGATEGIGASVDFFVCWASFVLSLGPLCGGFAHFSVLCCGGWTTTFTATCGLDFYIFFGGSFFGQRKFALWWHVGVGGSYGTWYYSVIGRNCGGEDYLV